MARLRITLGRVVVTATLDDSNTARLIREVLPFESKAQRWGDEVYFATPIQAGEDDAQSEVHPGTLGYWPPGQALCLFFGQQPYSPVNVVGVLEGDPQALGVVQDGESVRVEQAD